MSPRDRITTVLHGPHPWRALAISIACLAGLFAHGVSRGMAELVGFELGAERRVLSSALLLIVLFAAPFLVVFAQLRPRLGRATWLALGAALLAGCALSTV